MAQEFCATIKTQKLIELERLLMLQEHMASAEFDALLGLKHSTKKRSTIFKIPHEDGKVFSNYFANVIINENKEKIIQPMRYRIRPEGSTEEVPSKFNVFNARLDSLEIRQTWKPLFMKNHGIVPFTNFYEWVKGPDNKAKLISFYPKGKSIMWAPCLWDEWISKDGRIHFKSFAIITDDPPDEIYAMGHDRCPIFLEKENINEWLNPKDKTKNEIYSLLKKREEAIFTHEWI